MERLPLITVIALVSGFGLVSFFSVLEALFPSRLASIRQHIDGRPGRSFLLGLINFLFFGAITLGFLALSENLWRFFFIPAILLIAALGISLTLGLSAVAGLVGERLFPSQTRFQQSLRGSALWYLGCLVPYLGWLGLLLYTALLGFGGFLLSWFSKPDQELVP
jgi:hypothetical protein